MRAATDKSRVGGWVRTILPAALLYFGSWPPLKAYYDAKQRYLPTGLKAFYVPAVWFCKSPMCKEPMHAYWLWCYERFGGEITLSK